MLTVLLWWNECCSVTEHYTFEQERISREMILCAQIYFVGTLFEGLYTVNDESAEQKHTYP